MTDITPTSPPAAKTTTVIPSSEVFSIYAVISYSLDRLMGAFYGSGWHEFSIYYKSGYPNAVSWDESAGQAYMTLGEADAALSKFKPAHELGHILQLDAIQPSSVAELEAFFIDCSFGGGEHTVHSQEYTSCANVEGFAHYVSAATWNNLGDNADGIWMDWTADGSSLFSGYSLHDIEIGTDALSAYCSGTACCGYGVEIDWARMFWDFRTDGSSGKPGSMDFLNVYDNAYIWNTSSTICSSGESGNHFVSMENSVGSVLGATMEGRFSSDAYYNGSNH